MQAKSRSGGLAISRRARAVNRRGSIDDMAVVAAASEDASDDTDNEKVATRAQRLEADQLRRQLRVANAANDNLKRRLIAAEDALKLTTLEQI